MQLDIHLRTVSVIVKIPLINYPKATDTLEDDIEQITKNGKDRSCLDDAATIYG